MPIGQIRQLLGAFCGLQISAGEIAEILHDVADLVRGSEEHISPGEAGQKEAAYGARAHPASRPLWSGAWGVVHALAGCAQRVATGAGRADGVFVGKLFPFVEYAWAPSKDCTAERAIRPAVVARKISGETRSARGSHTTSVLRSLFESWTLEGRDTLDACREMITRAATARSAPAG